MTDQTTPVTLPQQPILGVEQLNDLRKRVLAGDTPSTEELAAGIRAIRQGRASAMAAKAAKPSKKKATGEAAVAELDDILGGLGI